MKTTTLAMHTALLAALAFSAGHRTPPSSWI